jgi:hypothetical protein
LTDEWDSSGAARKMELGLKPAAMQSVTFNAEN